MTFFAIITVGVADIRPVTLKLSALNKDNMHTHVLELTVKKLTFAFPFHVN